MVDVEVNVLGSPSLTGRKATFEEEEQSGEKAYQSVILTL